VRIFDALAEHQDNEPPLMHTMRDAAQQFLSSSPTARTDDELAAAGREMAGYLVHAEQIREQLSADLACVDHFAGINPPALMPGI
jgi:hypothetical protein